VYKKNCFVDKSNPQAEVWKAEEWNMRHGAESVGRYPLFFQLWFFSFAACPKTNKTGWEP